MCRFYFWNLRQTGLMCTLIVEKEVGTAMQLLSNTIPFLLPFHFMQQTQSGASRWYWKLYICECKNCFLHPYEQHVDLNSALEILTVQCYSLPCELWQKLYSVKNKKISSGNILRQMWVQLLKLLVKVNYALKPSKDVCRSGQSGMLT
jgi:hypothetical protein